MVAMLASRCSGARPGRDGVVLSTSGSVVNEDGTMVEEYEVGEVARQKGVVGLGFVSYATAVPGVLGFYVPACLLPFSVGAACSGKQLADRRNGSRNTATFLGTILCTAVYTARVVYTRTKSWHEFQQR